MKPITHDSYGFDAVFTKQDQELLAAFRRIQKFRIKRVSQLKHGWYYNIRCTMALPNAYTEKYLVTGTPRRDKDYCSKPFPWIVAVAEKHERFKGNYIPQDKPVTTYADTLFSYNHAYKLNSKVEHFVELLIRADRFQQWCLLEDRPYTRDEFEDFRFQQLHEQEMNRLMDDAFMDVDD